eukprot:3282286-Rhodomonas_salina.2
MIQVEAHWRGVGLGSAVSLCELGPAASTGTSCDSESLIRLRATEPDQKALGRYTDSEQLFRSDAWCPPPASGCPTVGPRTSAAIVAIR